MLTRVSIQICFTGTLTTDGEASTVEGSFEFCWT